MGRLNRRMGGAGDHPPRLRTLALRRARQRGVPLRAAGPNWSGGARALVEPLARLFVDYGSSYHVPVMVREVLQYLRPERGGTYLDGTLGGGGHAEAILSVSADARLIGVDRDPEAREEAGRRLERFGERFEMVAANFADAAEVAAIKDGSLYGVLLDLGISSHQVDTDRRGFTFRAGAPLDMRMEGMQGYGSAADVLNSYAEDDLAGIFYRFGEERRSRRLARVIVDTRTAAPFARSEDLVAAIDRAIPGAMNQDRARIFQALRIAVNREVEALGQALPRFREALSPGGVMVVISYHSLEDRLVKDEFREWSRECVCPPGLPICQCRGKALGVVLTRKPVRPSSEEIEANTRARSARLRAWRKA